MRAREWRWHSTEQCREVEQVRARERRWNNTKQCREAKRAKARERRRNVSEERRGAERTMNRGWCRNDYSVQSSQPLLEVSAGKINSQSPNCGKPLCCRNFFPFSIKIIIKLLRRDKLIFNKSSNKSLPELKPCCETFYKFRSHYGSW